MLFMHREEKPISVGMVIILHNFQIYNLNNVFRLNSTFKSYYYQYREIPKESGEEVVGQILQIVELGDWQN